MLSDEDTVAGVWLRDRVDPVDGRFRIVEMRIPMDPVLAKRGYDHAYAGRVVAHRIRRFAAAFLEATRDITHAHAGRILRAAAAAEEEVPNA